MHIHRTTPQDVWNRVKVARKVHRSRAQCPPARTPGWNRLLTRGKAYFAKMKGTPVPDVEIFPVEAFWSFVGSFAGMLLLSWCNWEVFARADNLLLMPTFGASSMLLFGAPQVPFAQPRNVVGGHVVSALVGITIYNLLGEASYCAPALAVALAIAGMHLTGTLHPPGGGTALMMVTGTPAIAEYGYFTAVFPVAVGALILVAVALVSNNLARDRRYPVSWW